MLLNYYKVIIKKKTTRSKPILYLPIPGVSEVDLTLAFNDTLIWINSRVQTCTTIMNM